MANADEEQLQVLTAAVQGLSRKVEALMAEKDFNSKVPLPLREVAEVCHVEYEWLRTRVKYKEVPAYRSTAHGQWRVFPADVKAFVMQECNIKRPARRKPVLKALGL